MRACIVFLVTLFITTSVNAVTLAYEKTAHHYKRIQHDPQALRMFIANMPKGGLLHEHFWGSEFAENLIDMAQKQKFCVNKNTYALSVINERCSVHWSLASARNQPELYNRIINAWSMRYFIPTNQESAHSHFFKAFDKFHPIYNAKRSMILANQLNQLASEKVAYVEFIVLNKMAAILQMASSLTNTTDPISMQKALVKAGLADIVKQIQTELREDKKYMRQQLHCGTSNAMPGCKVELRYQYAAFRDGTPAQVFSMLLAGFMLAQQDPHVVAINLVGPENGYPSMHDYTQHMQWVHLLHQQYPSVNISLHAGELTQQLVPPQGLRDHIAQAIQIAGAKRIGHGVDIAHEKNSLDVLKNMRDKHILVEINLTSNNILLGVNGKHSPLPLYLHHRVPVALSRDDAGILRTDINNEFVTAAYTYNLSYTTLKQLVNNSITYSFLPGKSLWENPAKLIPVSACAHDRLGAQHPSPSCKQFLQHHLKAKLQWQVLTEFNRFEQQYA